MTKKTNIASRLARGIFAPFTAATKGKNNAFRDGDILYAKLSKEWVIIYKQTKEHLKTKHYVSPCLTTGRLVRVRGWSGSLTINDNNIKRLRLATDSERLLLFDAMAKKGIRWNPDRKQIENLSEHCAFKPYDKVLARDAGGAWKATFFSHYEPYNGAYPYICGSLSYEQCIPYEGNEALVGIRDDSY